MLTDNPAQNALPFHFYGVIYLRHIQLPPNTSYVRFAETRILAPNHFSNLFGCSYQDVGAKLFGSGTLRRPRAEGLVPQRKGNTRERVKSATEGLAIFPGMNEITVNPLGMDLGDEEDHNAYLPLGNTVITNASQLLTDIFYQFPSCIIQKLGNTKYIPGVEQSHLENYCPLEHSERQKITVAEMETLDLSGLFYQVQWKRSSHIAWRNAFSAMFPAKGHNVPYSAQHYNNLLYYRTWMRLMDELTQQQSEAARAEMWDKIRKLPWLPNATNTRLWSYHRTPPRGEGFNSIPIAGYGGPQILINPDTAGVVSIAYTPEAIARREEEEESE